MDRIKSYLAQYLKPADQRPFSSPLPGFDSYFYLYWYPDVRNSGTDPLVHYLAHGWREGRDPSAGFSTDGYLATNPDVAESGINPLLHFLDYGLVEGRSGWQRDPKAAPPSPRPAGPPPKLLMPPEAEETDPLPQP